MIKTLGIENTKTLYIFDVFVIDKSLKKWKNEKVPKGLIPLEKDSDGVFARINAIDEYEDPENFVLAGASLSFMPGNRLAVFGSDEGKKSLLRMVKSIFSAKPVTIQDTFERILLTMDEVAKYDDRNEDIDKMISNAKELGQSTLVNQLIEKKAAKSFENILFALDRRKFLTEDQLLEFGKKCEKGLCLDWVKDYVRPIPENVVTEKRKCDDSMLFDNYVILHYDPDNKATSEKAREAELAKRKDPILFGVVKSSRNLYFVADWKDELCDLTIQDIVNKLGHDLEIK